MAKRSVEPRSAPTTSSRCNDWPGEVVAGACAAGAIESPLKPQLPPPLVESPIFTRRGVGADRSTAEGLTVGATIGFTVRGVNDAGEGPTSPADTVVVA